MVLLSRAGASQPTRDCLTAWETTIDPWHGANGPFMAISGTGGAGVGVGRGTLGWGHGTLEEWYTGMIETSCIWYLLG